MWSSSPVTGLDRPRGFQEIKVPRFHDNGTAHDGGKVVSRYVRCVYIYIYIYTHTHTHIYIYIYIHIYTHTYMHTYIQSYIH